MATLTIGNWNVEWMNRWFAADAQAPRWKTDAEAGFGDLQGLAARVAAVIEGMGADLVTIQEGPSRIEEMRLFVDDHLGPDWGVVGPAGRGQQKVYALVRPGGSVAGAVRVTERDGFDFEEAFDADIDADAMLEPYRLTRPPLVVDLTLADGTTLEVLSLHAKSKFVFNGAALWRDPARRQEFVEMALTARRRIAAEALRVRQYLDRRFAEDEGARIVVTGDLNDGPGLDTFERLYLAQNVAGLIAGSPYQPRRMLRHAFIDVVDKEDNFTVVFDDFVDGIANRRVLLDHVFVSPALFWDADGARATTGAVLHDLWAAQSNPQATTERERRTSDHRPQVATIRLDTAGV